jgi:hypothetical protein
MKRCTQAVAKFPALTTENNETPKIYKADTMQIIISSIFT